MTIGWNWRKSREFKLMLKCHCACSLEIGTCIINAAGRQAAHKKPNKNTRFLVESRQKTFYTHVLKANINFQRKEKYFKKITKLNDIIPFLYLSVLCDNHFQLLVKGLAYFPEGSDIHLMLKRWPVSLYETLLKMHLSSPYK